MSRKYSESIGASTEDGYRANRENLRFSRRQRNFSGERHGAGVTKVGGSVEGDGACSGLRIGCQRGEWFLSGSSVRRVRREFEIFSPRQTIAIETRRSDQRTRFQCEKGF